VRNQNHKKKIHKKSASVHHHIPGLWYTILWGSLLANTKSISHQHEEIKQNSLCSLQTYSRRLEEKLEQGTPKSNHQKATTKIVDAV